MSLVTETPQEISDIPENGTENKQENEAPQDESTRGDQDQSSAVKQKAGYAPIKSEYLLLNYKPTIQTEYLSSEIKKKITAEDEGDTKSEDGKEPPNKKAKLTGRNKKRPRNERIDEKDKLCPSVKQEKECKYGDNCKFSHDVKIFLEKKEPDIEGSCPVYETFGFCRFGVTCRFAGSHLGENAENLTNKELYETMKDKAQSLNILKEDVRHKLWKRKYDFKKSMTSVDDVQKLFNKNTDHDKDLLPDCGDGKKKVAVVPCADDVPIRSRPREIKKIDFHNKLYLAPLTTVGNLPFRRVCKNNGADITCGEMALASQILKAKASEWSLIKRHPSEDIFGVQVCGAYPDMMTKCAQVIAETTDVDFIDINCGCPIDLVFQKGAGSALMGRASKLEQICRSMMGVMGDMPLTVKLRTGVFDNKNVAHNIIPRLRDAGVSLVTIHGRSREQRYTRVADWDYIDFCAKLGNPMPVFGNGDILSYEDANLLHMEKNGVSGVMIARGALIKPWIFTEIKEQRHWDISSGERFDMLKSFSNYGLEHWGSDHQGVETTRRFLLEWLSFLHRYIPVGLLEQLPQKINQKPPYYTGRNDLETLMASPSCADWIKISEMLLGPVPSSFQFLPKHKANAYQ